MKRTILGLVTAVLILPLSGVATAGSASAHSSADRFQLRYDACMEKLGDAPRSADVLQGWITGCRTEALR
jgi:hypothetical protein